MRTANARCAHAATAMLALFVLVSCGSGAGKQAAVKPAAATTPVTVATPTTHRVVKPKARPKRKPTVTKKVTPATLPPAPPTTRAPVKAMHHYIAPPPPPAPAPPAPPPPAPAPVVTAATGAEGAMVAGINAFSASHGLPPLALHSNLMSKARLWAMRMASGGCGTGNGGVPNICHSVLTSCISVQWTRLAENVGMISPSGNTAGMESAFEHSPGHAENMLSPQAQYVGVGVAYVRPYMYVAEEFMAA